MSKMANVRGNSIHANEAFGAQLVNRQPSSVVIRGSIHNP